MTEKKKGKSAKTHMPKLPKKLPGMNEKTPNPVAAMGKQTSRYETVHHTIETDHKGKQHHRTRVNTETVYEHPHRPKTPMNKLLDSRGY